MVEKIIAVEPTDERARVWHEDLLFVEAQDRNVLVVKTRKLDAVDALVDVEESADQPGEKIHGEEKYLRYHRQEVEGTDRTEARTPQGRPG